jgi:hypothetical protein
MPLVADPQRHIQPYHHPLRRQKVDLASVAALLHKHVTESLCEAVFEANRTTEREREWSLYAMVQFWIAVTVRTPEALTHLLDQCQKEDDSLLPQVSATSEAFFSKAKNFKWEFFLALYKALMPRLLKEAPCVYASQVQNLSKHFRQVWIMDGSQLDEVARKLKILRNVKGAVLPGRLFAFYDLFRGICRHLQFDPDAARNENLLATESLQLIPEGTLMLGDRLFGVIKHFKTLQERKSWGVFRRNATVTLKVIEVLSRRQAGGRSYLEDSLVEVGAGEDKVTLRLIRYSDGKRKLEVFTSVLDVKKLPPATVVELYGLRWGIERMFYDLKIVLNLNRFYAGNPNAIAAQVYTGTMVYNAFRIMQGRIAQTHGIRPETLSPAKLYPRLIDACSGIAEYELTWHETVKANPNVKLHKPSYKAWATLETILVEKKIKPRTKGIPNPRSVWLSWKNIPGGQELVQKLT